ncbi:MAG TPA: hypothetical protein VGP55_14990 [Chitinophagaceae bacterium]|nr:hypothetical protein [Chitinophagaceae bacterium]
MNYSMNQHFDLELDLFLSFLFIVSVSNIYLYIEYGKILNDLDSTLGDSIENIGIDK